MAPQTAPLMWRRVALVRICVSEERIASIIRTLGARNNVSSNQQRPEARCWLLLTLFLAHWFSSTLWWKRYVPPTRRFLQEVHGVTSQKTPFFIVTTVKTSNLALFASAPHACHFIARYRFAAYFVLLTAAPAWSDWKKARKSQCR
jgi:hypothetical protein